MGPRSGVWLKRGGVQMTRTEESLERQVRKIAHERKATMFNLDLSIRKALGEQKSRSAEGRQIEEELIQLSRLSEDLGFFRALLGEARHQAIVESAMSTMNLIKAQEGAQLPPG